MNFNRHSMSGKDLSIRLLDLNNSRELFSFYHKTANRMVSICFARLTLGRKHYRLSVFRQFILDLLRLNRLHGSMFVIKYLKASVIAVQRRVGGCPLNSLRALEPDLPLPSLIDGLPPIISKRDRQAIAHLGDPGIVRYWLTLLSIYRILKGPFKPKLSTITNPYSGIDPSKYFIYIKLFSDYLKGKGGSFRPTDLKANKFYVSWKASSTQKYSWLGLLTDFLFLQGPLKETIERWLAKYPSQVLTFFAPRHMRRYIEGIISKAYSHYGSLAFKEEPAGKLRIFALVDSITQTILQPLHALLFKTLNTQLLECDGTFDQNASFWRGVEKMQRYKVAFSLDLTAATDRLPLVIQKELLSQLFNDSEMGDLWGDILTNRDYFIPSNQYGLPVGPIRYAVGQPMGALSSWAMLALTHHMIVGIASYLTYGRFVMDRHEVLGDDIVIFDVQIARLYLLIMKDLGVEINEFKSIQSLKGTAFEFAKRTFFNGEDVSPIPWKLLMLPSDPSVVSSLFEALQKWRRINWVSLYAICNPFLSKLSFKDIYKDKAVKGRLFSLLGSRIVNNSNSLRDYLALQLDPRWIKSSWGGFPTLTVMRTLLGYQDPGFKPNLYVHLWPLGLVDVVFTLFNRLFMDFSRSRGQFIEHRSKEIGMALNGWVPDRITSFIKDMKDEDLKNSLYYNVFEFLKPVPLYLDNMMGSWWQWFGWAISDPLLFSRELSKYNSNKPSLLSAPARAIAHIEVENINQLPGSSYYSDLAINEFLQLENLYKELFLIDREFDASNPKSGLSVDNLWRWMETYDSLAQRLRSRNMMGTFVPDKPSRLTIGVQPLIRMQRNSIKQFLRLHSKKKLISPNPGSSLVLPNKVI